MTKRLRDNIITNTTTTTTTTTITTTTTRTTTTTTTHHSKRQRTEENETIFKHNLSLNEVIPNHISDVQINDVERYYPPVTDLPLEEIREKNIHLLSRILKNPDGKDYSRLCAEIRDNLTKNGIELPNEYKYSLDMLTIISGKKEDNSTPNIITYVLTCAPPSPSSKVTRLHLRERQLYTLRCEYVRKCWSEDLIRSNVCIVMSQSDYENMRFLSGIGLSKLENWSSRLKIAIIPDGIRTAGNTRSWCIWLASREAPDTICCIRDDRRRLVTIIGNKSDETKNVKLDVKLEHGCVYSPRGELSWKSKNKPSTPTKNNFLKTTQVLCATALTLKIFLDIIKSYPNGPILEDHLSAMYDFLIGFESSDFGGSIGIITNHQIVSIARKDDTKIISAPYSKKIDIGLAIQMARRLFPAVEKISFDENGYASFTIKLGSEKVTFSNKPGGCGGGQTHTIAMLYMLQNMKNQELCS